MEMFLGILIDVLLCALVLIFIIGTAKKGFAATVFNILAFFGAFVLAAVIANYLSGWIFDTFFVESVTDKISNATTSLVADSTSEQIKSFVSTEFPFLFNYSNISGIGINTDAISGAVGTTAGEIATSLIKPIFVSLISVFVYIISLIVCIPVLRFIGKKLSKIFNISIVGKVNAFLGAILGFVKGVVAVFIISAILVFVMGMFLEADSPLSYGIQNSFVINFVNDTIIL